MKYFLNSSRPKIVLFFLFIIFLIFYLINFDYLTNLFATDYYNRYKPNGINLIKNIVHLNFDKINIFNNFLIPEFITGFLLYFYPNEKIFSVVLNIVNIFFLFFSIYFFIKRLNYKNNNLILFFLFFLIYSGNWIYCFYKLPDVIFLFFFSLIFYSLFVAFETNNKNYFFISIILAFISLWVRPQGVICISLVILCYFIYFFKLKNLINFCFFVFLVYFIIFPFLIFFLTKFNINGFLNKVVLNYIDGNIYFSLHYYYQEFLSDFDFNDNLFSKVIYLYFLFIKKIFYQLIFIRETYSLKHNMFLIIYAGSIYWAFFFNAKKLYLRYRNFTFILLLTTVLSLLFHGSVALSAEPNRYHLFHLVPTYLLIITVYTDYIKRLMDI